MCLSKPVTVTVNSNKTSLLCDLSIFCTLQIHNDLNIKSGACTTIYYSVVMYRLCSKPAYLSKPKTVTVNNNKTSLLRDLSIFCTLQIHNDLNIKSGACSIKHYGVVMYRLCSKPAYLSKPKTVTVNKNKTSLLCDLYIFCTLQIHNDLNIKSGACTIKHYGVVMYRLCSKPVYLSKPKTVTVNKNVTSLLRDLFIHCTLRIQVLKYKPKLKKLAYG
jgi:hypothetical protein